MAPKQANRPLLVEEKGAIYQILPRANKKIIDRFELFLGYDEPSHICDVLANGIISMAAMDLQGEGPEPNFYDLMREFYGLMKDIRDIRKAEHSQEKRKEQANEKG